MRVIAGCYKGRKLKAPKGMATRPTSDRVKEAVFNTLAPVLTDCKSFLDLFAGTGAVGIEALSRGVEECIFVENRFAALKVLKDNVKFCTDQKYEILKMDVLDALDKLEQNKFQIVFMDPPYNYQQLSAVIMKTGSVVSKGGIVVVETSSKKELPQEIGPLLVKKRAVYGDTKVSYFKKIL